VPRHATACDYRLMVLGSSLDDSILATADPSLRNGLMASSVVNGKHTPASDSLAKDHRRSNPGDGKHSWLLEFIYTPSQNLFVYGFWKLEHGHLSLDGKARKQSSP